MPENFSAPENSNSHPSADGPTPGGAEETPRAKPAAEAPAESPDRRAAPRRKKLLRVQVVDSLQGGPPFPGWVVDRSVGGMRIEVDHELEIGTTLKVRRYEGADLPWVDLRVQSVRPFEGAWHVGCQFVRSPSWEVLMQFG